MAIVVYAPSLALAQVTGINMDLSIALTFLVSIGGGGLGGVVACGEI